MIKLLHTADWHIGKNFFGCSMLEDQKYFFDNYFFPTLERLGFGKNDCVIVAGDIFDRAAPSLAAVELFDNVITKVSEMGIGLLAITGNHDGAARFSMGSRLMRNSGVYLYTSLRDTLEPLTLDDGCGTRAVIHPLPHFDIAEGKAFLGTGAGDDGGSQAGYAGIFSRIVSGTDFSDSAAQHVLVAHCTAFGDDFCPFGPQADVRSVGGSDAVPVSCFEPFALTLLGHIHRDMAVSDTCGYSGSPLAYSFDSAGTVRSMRYYELERDSIRMSRVYIEKPLHPLAVLDGSFDELMGEGTPPSDDYIYAMLSDSALIYEPMNRLRPKFPNIMGVGYTSENTVGMPSEYRDYLRSSLRSRSIGDSEVFGFFLRQMCGTEPTEDDMAMFDSLCREVFSGEE